VLLDQPERQSRAGVTQQCLVAPMRHDGGFGMQPSSDQCRKGAIDVGVRMGAHQPTHVLDADHRVDLPDDLVHVER
jgi:hypothetical protein